VTCELSQTRLHAYFDGELDAAGAAEFERHMEACPDCETRLAAEEKLRSALAGAQLYERAPQSLRQKLETSLPKAPFGASASAPASSSAANAWRWLAVAAVLLLAVLFGWEHLQNLNYLSRQQTMATSIVDAHLRSLQPGHLEDVISTDQHTVKPWFDGRLDFAPPVRDYANDGFPLMGGRLDVIDGRTVAALVYGRRKHVVNVFVAKTQPQESLAGAGELQGYHWLAWRQDGFSFCAVSDAAAPDLDQLKQLFLAK
jgi:mycothiol system anti-sigma-R factor